MTSSLYSQHARSSQHPTAVHTARRRFHSREGCYFIYRSCTNITTKTDFVKVKRKREGVLLSSTGGVHITCSMYYSSPAQANKAEPPTSIIAMSPAESDAKRCMPPEESPSPLPLPLPSFSPTMRLQRISRSCVS